MRPLDALARGGDTALRAASLWLRTARSADANPVPADWTHVTKVDPEPGKQLPLLYPLYLRHTGAVAVGGSRDVTSTNTEETFDLLAHADVPAFHEPSAADHVTDRTRRASEFLALPEVLNGDAESLVGTLGAGTESLRDELVPALVRQRAGWLPDRWVDRLSDFLTSYLLSAAVFEAYVIQNPDSAAAREASVGPEDLLSPGEAARRALAAEKHLGSKVVYVEYSGTYGGDEAERLLASVADAVSWSRVWYGGGIDDAERATRMLDAGADTVVVGDAFHRVADEEQALLAAAKRDLDSAPSAERIEEWAADVVDDDSAAVRYLSTVPAVGDPRERAHRYVAATVAVRLALDRGDAPADAVPSADLQQAVGPLLDAYERAAGGDDGSLPLRHLGAFGADAD